MASLWFKRVIPVIAEIDSFEFILLENLDLVSHLCSYLFIHSFIYLFIY